MACLIGLDTGKREEGIVACLRKLEAGKMEQGLVTSLRGREEKYGAAKEKNNGQTEAVHLKDLFFLHFGGNEDKCRGSLRFT